ncbi:MAG: ABC transporter permease [Streptosporangiaceae bacterium]
MLPYLRLEVLRVLRNKTFLILNLGMPIGFYLLFTSLFGGTTVRGVDQTVQFMVSMAAFGGMGAALWGTGPRIAQERQLGWLRQLRATPLPAREVITAKVLAALVLALPALILVSIVGVVVHGVHLAAWQWAAMLALLWVGALPFAALGVLIGSLTNTEASQIATNGVYLVLAALGGLWMPVKILPSVLQHVAHALPSNRYGELGWQIVAGHAPTLASGLVLAAWTVGVGALAAYAYRRREAVR